MSAFEAQMGDVVDPSPLEFSTVVPEGSQEMWGDLTKVAEYVVEQIVQVMRENRPALVQWVKTNGYSLTAALPNPHTLQIVVQSPAEHPFITITYATDPEDDGA